MKKKIFTKKEIKKITGAAGSQKIDIRFYYVPPFLNELRKYAARAEVPYLRAREIQNIFRLNDGKLAKVLGATGKQLTEMKKSNRLNAKAIIVFFRITWVLSIAKKVFENEKAAVEWLSRPQFALGDRIPLYVLKSYKWLEEVESILNRIEFGGCV